MARSALCPRLAALSNCESYDGRRPFPGCVGLELQHIGAGSEAFKACSTQRGSDRRQNHGPTRTRITFLSYSVSSAWVISLPSWAYTRPPLLRHALRAFWHGPISVWRRQRAATFSSSSIVAIVRSFPLPTAQTKTAPVGIEHRPVSRPPHLVRRPRHFRERDGSQRCHCPLR